MNNRWVGVTLFVGLLAHYHLPLAAVGLSQ